MIREFPYFEKLHLDHKKDIVQHIAQYPPYSDYNFTSLWTYDTQNAVEVACLNTNLVIQFTDYQSLHPFYSFLGTSHIQDTVARLLEYSHEKKLTEELKLIPEIVIATDTTLFDSYHITEDVNNHDYIVSTDEVATLPHHKYRTKKQQIEQFKKLYPHHTLRLIDLREERNHREMEDLFMEWRENAFLAPPASQNEQNALNRLFAFSKHFETGALGVYDQNKLVGFTIFETTHNNYGIYSFQKANRAYRGIYTYMCHEAAKLLQEKGCIHINYEQDMGIQGMRTAKLLWKPTHFLKKYSIRKKSGC